ncbi:ABC transporter permease [Streptomyces sp. NPDC006798]|uniref:ABC transporter permease n=1 Tax=Streptomyces sp. NPDC006798 TaxID=3155462 RepID=UPI0033D49527
MATALMTDGGTGARSTAVGRLSALGRAELTLLVRNRAALFVALLLPLAMVLAMQSSLKELDLGRTEMSLAEAAVIGGTGFILLLVIHVNLVSAYVARREELVLKRLRTGEISDREILAGTALPAVGLALAQVVLLVAASIALLDVGAPKRPDLLLAGVVLGVVLLVALALVVSAVTRTVESAQLTTMPVYLVSALGSGLFVPLELMPDRVASIAELLPMTGVMTLIRDGWVGASDGKDLLGAALTALAWIALSVFAVNRWFRWEPRR